MSFPISPVSAQEESLNVDLDGIDTSGGSKFDKLNGDFGATCVGTSYVPADDYVTGEKPRGQYVFEFLGTEGAAAGLTFTRRVRFPDFAEMLLGMASAMGVKPVTNEAGKKSLPLDNCRGVAVTLTLAREAAKNGSRVYTNIKRVTAAKTTQPTGPQVL